MEKQMAVCLRGCQLSLRDLFLVIHWFVYYTMETIFVKFLLVINDLNNLKTTIAVLVKNNSGLVTLQDEFQTNCYQYYLRMY